MGISGTAGMAAGTAVGAGMEAGTVGAGTGAGVGAAAVGALVSVGAGDTAGELGVRSGRGPRIGTTHGSTLMLLLMYSIPIRRREHERGQSLPRRNYAALCESVWSRVGTRKLQPSWSCKARSAWSRCTHVTPLDCYSRTPTQLVFSLHSTRGLESRRGIRMHSKFSPRLTAAASHS